MSTAAGLEVALRASDELGEGPLWSVAEQSLYRVDIIGRCLRRWRPSDGEQREWSLHTEVGCLALCRSGGAVLAMRDGFHHLDFESGELTALLDPEPDLHANRFNDGKCDPRGRFWAGTLQDGETEPAGSLWTLSGDGRVERRIGGLLCSNGLGWSPDGRVFYHTDTWTHRIMAHDHDLESARLSNARVFAALPPDRGAPDGLCVDAEGGVWSCQWDGWRAVRFRPDGTIDRELALPVARPTSCTFGGSDLTTLYITSARHGLAPDALREQPLAGSVFALTCTVGGRPEPLFDA